MIFAVFAIVCVIVCWKTGKWRNWKEFYPTILYFYIGDVASDFLLYHKPLWSFSELSLTYPFLDLIVNAFLYPCTAILFLSYFPKDSIKRILYIVLCAGIYTAIEAVAFLLGDFKYYNGWNLLYTVIFNLLMFPLLLLHSKKPILAWPVSTVLAFALIWWFKIPLAR